MHKRYNYMIGHDVTYTYGISGGSCASREQSQACLIYAEMEQRRRSQRRLKLTGDSKLLDVCQRLRTPQNKLNEVSNADLMVTYTVLNEPTLYPSAYVVLGKKEYTKHYYAGTNRVAACLGGGHLDVIQSQSNWDGTGKPPAYMQEVSDRLFKESLNQVYERVLMKNDPDCITEIYEYVDGLHHPIDGIPERVKAEVAVELKDFRNNVRDMRGYLHDERKNVYYYHSDHLGSASWITDYRGMAVQHIQYLPYGEPYIDQRAAGTTYSERFRFTGKERDEETGYGYFGARYMDHELMPMWLSVDPMADKYPSLSPYNYCAWNPVKLVDPDGMEMDDYKLNTKTGSLVLVEKTTNNFDMIIPDNGEEPLIVSKGILNGKKPGDDVSKTGFSATKGKQAEGIKVMVYISFNSHLELAAWGYNDTKGKPCLDVAPWDHNEPGKSWSYYISGEYDRKGVRKFHVHTHPGTEDGRGGFAYPSSKDADRAKNFMSNYYIISKNQGLSQYDSKRNCWEPSENKTPDSLLPYRRNKKS